MILDDIEKRLLQGVHLDFKGEDLRYLTALIRKVFERERERQRSSGLVLLAIPEDLARQIAAMEVVP